MDLQTEELHRILRKVSKNEATPKNIIHEVQHTKEKVKTLKTTREKRQIVAKSSHSPKSSNRCKKINICRDPREVSGRDLQAPGQSALRGAEVQVEDSSLGKAAEVLTQRWASGRGWGAETQEGEVREQPCVPAGCQDLGE